jgi:hypothetical protein
MLGLWINFTANSTKGFTPYLRPMRTAFEFCLPTGAKVVLA